MEKKRDFPGISPSAWEHPADRAALSAFSSIPLASELLRKAMGSSTEQSLRLGALADSARASESQFGRIYAVLKDCAERLDLRPLPELFVRLDPMPDVRCLGTERPFIIVTSGAIELWDDEELASVLGHEIGHILSGHSVYKTLLAVLIQASSFLAGNLPLGGAAIAAAQAALKEWDRKSELSADRASLLVTQDAPTVFRALMKSAAGPRIDQMDINEFFRQASEYEAGGEAIGSVLKIVDVLGSSHPFPVVRMTALQEWEKGGDYQRILSGDYPRRGGTDERDPLRDFERATSSYAEEFGASRDPFAQAASKVMDAVNGLFGQGPRTGGGGGDPGAERGAQGPHSIEDVIDGIFGSKH